MKKFSGGLRNKKYKHEDSDEYYTPMETVENVFQKLGKHIEGKKIWFPCDTEESAFVKYAKLHGLNFKASSNNFLDNKELLEWCDVVITNPPFSKLPTFCNFIKGGGKDFAFFTNIGTSYIVLRRIKTVAFSVPTNFFRPNGQIVRVGNIGCVNSFGISDDIPLPSCENPQFEYDDKTNIPILNSVKKFPKYSIAPKLMLVTATVILRDISAWEIVKVEDPVVNGKKKFSRILIRKREEHG